MLIRELELGNFRNYRELRLSLHEKISILTGKNGVGKTSVLEAVSVLSTGRSFRSGKNSDFIRGNEESAFLSTTVFFDGLESELKARIYPQGKKIFVDEKLIKSSSQLSEILPVIIFSPADHQIIDGDSAERKQFLNRCLAAAEAGYSELFRDFSRVLLQRNRILKDASDESWAFSRLQDVLLGWDAQFLRLSGEIFRHRRSYLQRLAPVVEAEYRRISLTNDVFTLAYDPSGISSGNFPSAGREFEEFFSKMLRDSLRRDLACGSTQVGPHKDEIVLTLNGNKVKFYGSQGEKKTCALALRVGELILFREKLGRSPMLLFDDVSSELDQVRRQSLVNLLRQENTQVLITATELPSTLLGEVGKSFEHLDLHSVGVRN